MAGEETAAEPDGINLTGEAVAEITGDEVIDSMPVKQVIVIQSGLKVRRGKEIAQGAHASMAWLTKRLRHVNTQACGDDARMMTLTQAEWAWVNGNFRKVVCRVRSEAELLLVWRVAQDAGLTAELITDDGLTEFHGEPTITALAVGPDWEHLIDPVTRELELY